MAVFYVVIVVFKSRKLLLQNSYSKPYCFDYCNLQYSAYSLLVYVIVCLFEYAHVRTLFLHVYSPNQCLNIYEDVNARIHVISICAREFTFPCCIYVYAYVVPNHVVSLCTLLFTFPCCIYMCEYI